MSTPFYDLASLVVVPSGYKASKVYAQKPLTTDGQLTFSRASAATRVNSAGLIEKVRTNLALFSQAYSSGAWLTLNSTKVSTSATDPNGGSTACNITWGAGTGAYLYQSIAQTGYYTVSMWVKSNGGGNNFRLFGDGTASFSPNFTATSSWQRFSFTFNGTGGSSWGISHNSTQNAADLLVAFAQLETGDIATDYIATTSAAVSVGPVANVPRLDYLNSSCPKLLLEPQRTNLLTYSESFDNAAWIKTEVTVTANNTTGPDGYLSADKIIPTAANATHYADRTGIAVGSNGLASVFVKKGEYQRFGIRSYFSGGFAIFDVNTGVIVNSTAVTAKIENYGNGWYRCSVNDTVNANYGYQIFVLQNTSTSLNSFTGNGIDGIFVWGAQVEVGAYATSYIPTLGASVTRLGDDLRKTGISSLIGQTEGVWYLDFTLINNGATYQAFMLSDGTSSNIVYMYRLSTSSLDFFVNGVGIGTFAGANNTRYKIAFAYKAGQHAVYINGTQVFTSTTSVAPTALSQLNADYLNTNSERLQSPIHQILLFKTRLTNAQLAELTTL